MKTTKKATSNPEFYFFEEMACEIPGSAFLNIEIWNDVFSGDELIGKTEIDLEDRFFCKKWRE